MNNLKLKKATSKNIAEILELEQSSVSKTYHARLDPEFIKTFIKNQFVFLIQKNEKTIGLVAYKFPKKNTVCFNGLVIAPKFRGRGFSRQAMLLALKKVSRYPRAELVVHPRNSPAVALYLSLGFVIEDWLDNHFGDGEPRIRMVRK